ncbi:type II toxin-antitoxin system RelE/ParE family toxin [uncultured Parabacteroides sp.]|uniref:type II toxin-antitoxin system RelE/ParE family toxin n=1 Tax=uncultured Parabacteroides sp. TaxID=512312 RepID=UPI00259071A3|nr:type II toxin-antitoxin system RelE/ParE family toxin [uncultured Parabacteroides sp.]
MYGEREIVAYKSFFWDFMATLTESESQKIYYVLDMLKVRERVSEKFVKHIKDGLYELRAEYNGNIYRLFFCFDKGKIVILFNGFQKKTKKTPIKEINKAIKLKEEYYGSKFEKR